MKKIISLILILIFTICSFSLLACGKNSTTDTNQNTNVITNTPNNEVLVDRISINKSSITIAIGETQKLIAAVSPSNATDKSIRWESSNEEVVIVANGTVVGLKAGVAIVSAYSSNNLCDTCVVQVTEPTTEPTPPIEEEPSTPPVDEEILVNSITLNKSSISLEVGNSEILNATISPSNADDKSITWESSNESVAMVSNGTIIALKSGIAIITAYASNNKYATCVVTVTEPVDNEPTTPPVDNEPTTPPVDEEPITPVVDEVIYSLTLDSGFFVVSGYTGNSSRIEIEQIHEGLRVIGIANNAFKGNTNLEEVVIPNTVETIGNNAFENCTALKSITLPTSIKTIGGYAFAGCTSLTNATLNEGLVIIGNNAFDHCSSLTSIVFPDTVETIGNVAFRYAEKLESITFSSSLESIGNSTFQNCVSLESVTLPENITSIGISAFSFCDGLKELKILGDITLFGNSSFYECHNIEKIYFASSIIGDVGEDNYIFYNVGIKGDGITLTIAENAYLPSTILKPLKENTNHPNIKKIVVENGATNVNYFTGDEYLPYLEEIVLPDTITDIEFGIFNNSLWWENQPNGAVYISNILYGYKGTSPSSLDINKSIVTVAKGALSNCQSLTELSIPFIGNTKESPTHTYIGYVFGAESYGNNVNVVPSSLKTISITNTETIYRNALYGCSSVETVKITNKLKTIESSAFSNCTSIKNVFFSGSMQEYSAITINSTGNTYFKNAEISYKCDTCTPKTPVKEYVIASTCTQKGSYDTVVYCSGCEAELSRETIITPANGHTEEPAVQENYIDSTCLNTGSYDMVVYCSVCDEELTRQSYTISAKGHNAGTAKKEKVVASTCTTSGSYQSVTYCTRCNLELSRKDVTTSALGHTEVTLSAVSPTCTQTGLTKGTKCSVCRQVLLAQEVVSALGHNEVVIPSVAPACEKTGLTEGSKCSRCGIIFTSQSTIPATGHNWVDKACSNCGIEAVLAYANMGSYYKVTGIGYCQDTVVEIPSTYNGKPVTQISANAFNGCTQIVELVIPDSVTSIGSGALKNLTNMKKLVIGKGITMVESGMLYGASSLEDITVPFVGKGGNFSETEAEVYNSCETAFSYLFGSNSYNNSLEIEHFFIGNNGLYTPVAYFPANLKNITISTATHAIISGSFQMPLELDTLTLPSGIQFYHYGGQTFGKISNVNFLGTLEEWCEIDFQNDGCFMNPCQMGSNLYINGELLTNATITSSIGDYQFEGCTSLTSVKFDIDGSCYWGYSSFYGCTNLKSIEIGPNVTSVSTYYSGSSAFNNCDSLESFIVDENNPYLKSIDNSFYSYNEDGTLNLVRYDLLGIKNQTEYTIVDGTTTIGDHAFYDCSSLTSITLPSSLTTIGALAFYDCSSLSSIIIPNGVTAIGSDAFYNCSTSLVIYCEATNKPSGWDQDWNSGDYTVKWEHTD